MTFLYVLAIKNFSDTYCSVYVTNIKHFSDTYCSVYVTNIKNFSDTCSVYVTGIKNFSEGHKHASSVKQHLYGHVSAKEW